MKFNVFAKQSQGMISHSGVNAFRCVLTQKSGIEVINNYSKMMPEYEDAYLKRELRKKIYIEPKENAYFLQSVHSIRI